MVNEDWDKFVEAYCSTFSVTRDFVEKLAVHDVLQLVVSGYSIVTIARRLDMEKEYIKEVCTQFLSFPGFPCDLDINPYFVFRRSSSLEDFKKEVRTISNVLDNDLDLCYNICTVYDKLKKELEIWD
jgi:hypothetical protein